MLQSSSLRLNLHVLETRLWERTMPAYMIALNRRVHDRQKLEAYWKAAGPTFEGRGAKFLSIYTPPRATRVDGAARRRRPD